MLRPMLGGLLVAGLVSVSEPGWVNRYDLGGCGERRSWSTSALAVSADAQTMVVLRLWKGAGPQGEVGESDLVYLSLRDGKEIARRSVAWSLRPQLAASRDGGTVVILRQLDAAQTSPYVVSVWKPYSGPADLKDVTITALRDPEVGWRAWFVVEPAAPPAISPDGVHVAMFGSEFRERTEPPKSSAVLALGVLNIDTGVWMSLPLPVSFDGQQANRRFWYLGWAADGSCVYAVLHGNYAGQPTGANDSTAQALPLRPGLTLYRFSPALRTVSRVGSVPTTTCGFGSEDDLIVADQLRGGWGPHKRYGLLPISKVAEQAALGGGAEASLGAAVKMDYAAPGDDSAGGSFRQLFVGRTHVYAEAVSGGPKHCVSVVEQTSSEK